MPNQRLLAVLTATTLLATGAALAASQNAEAPRKLSSQENAADHAFGKLSADGARAYQDITLTRLAIFDGRVADAKKTIGDADAGFAKAETDESVFTKAEADLKSPQQNQNQGHATSADTAQPQQGASARDAKTPIAWLPVDGTVSINEDYSLNPNKAAAVSDANKSLKAGDSKGAMAKLKVAAVDMSVTLAVVPLKQTIADVHQAVGMINDGKYYEASQVLRHAQDAERFDVASAVDQPVVAATSPKAQQPAPAPAKTSAAAVK